MFTLKCILALLPGIGVALALVRRALRGLDWEFGRMMERER